MQLTSGRVLLLKQSTHHLHQCLPARYCLHLLLHVLQLLHLFIDHINVFLNIEFTLAAIVVHVSDLAKNGSLLPSLHAAPPSEQRFGVEYMHKQLVVETHEMRIKQRLGCWCDCMELWTGLHKACVFNLALRKIAEPVRNGERYHVMNPTHAPHAAHVAIGIPPIHLVLVVQLDGDVQRLLWGVCPLKDLQCIQGATLTTATWGRQSGGGSDP